MAGQVTRSREADEDLTAIWVRIAADNPAAADRTIHALLDAEIRLAAFPETGRRRDDLQPALRSRVVGSYVVFYRASEGGIFVVRILHGARDIDDLLAET